MFNNRKLTSPLEIKGIGVHSGKEIKVWVEEGEGKDIVFYNKKRNCKLSLQIEYVKNFSSTFLIKENCEIKTIEHFMAVVYILGLDSIRFSISGDEFPILDGSAKEIVDLMLTHSEITGEKKDFFLINKKGVVVEKDSFIEYCPSDDFSVDYTIVYKHPSIGEMNFSIMISEEAFIKEISPARTFGFLKDAEYLKSKGYALGASFENTVVFDNEKLLNPPLRFENEMVRHKILDFIGDLSFLRKPVKGCFKVYKGGHSLHIKLVKELLNIN